MRTFTFLAAQEGAATVFWLIAAMVALIGLIWLARNLFRAPGGCDHPNLRFESWGSYEDQIKAWVCTDCGEVIPFTEDHR